MYLLKVVLFFGLFDKNLCSFLHYQILEAMQPSSTGEVSSRSLEKGAFVSISKTEAAQTETRKKKGSMKSSSSSIAEANHVLFGRGKRCTNNPGNQRMRRILDKYRVHYFGASCSEKRKLIRKAYGEIIEGGVKFLKPMESEDEWVEVDVELAIQKVGHSLRCRRSYRDNSQGSLTAKKATSRLQNGISIQATSGFIGASVVGSPMLPQNQMQQQLLSASIARPLGDELLRREIAQQPTLDLGLSLLPNPMTSLLARQLELERLQRLRLLPLIVRTPTLQPAPVSQQPMRAIEREQELMRIIASCGNIFS